jgi:CMP-N-acetylneuraminic acid synthetase
VNKIICIIPARKGSKRLKNKNIKDFYGKPIISQVIQKLKKFKIFEKIYVSTDCTKIANIAKKHRRSIFVSKDVIKNDVITENNIAVVRPSNGLHPKFFKGLLGKKFRKSFKKGSPLKLSHVN